MLHFDKDLLALGLNRSFAIRLYEQKLTKLVQSAKIAQVSVYDFLEMLKTTNIPVVDYPKADFHKELENLDNL